MSDANPHVARIEADLKARKTWADRDAMILKKRLGERSKKRQKPYPNAPNFVVRLIDDLVREKTDTEQNMSENAPLYAYVVPLSADITEPVRTTIERAFDTYLRHMLRIAPIREEALDCKNARGFAILKTIRRQHEDFGEIPTLEVCDMRNIVCPSDTKRLADAERIAEFIPLSPEAFLDRARENGWNMTIAREVAESGGDRAKSENEDTLETTKTLVGITTDDSEKKTIWIVEQWCIAGEWEVALDETKRVKKNDRCCVIWGLNKPEQILKIYPWREADTVIPWTPQEQQVEMISAQTEGREPKMYKGVEPGRQRAWPYLATRYENRSQYLYDSRGIGQLCMDEQIAATATLNAKMVMLEYFQQPLFTGAGARNSANVTFEPGSFVPEGTAAVQMPQIPQQFDFDLEMYRRNSARRVGSLSQYEFSGELSRSKKVQKTATEVREQTMHGGMVSAASVDRFNEPWAEVYQALWKDLKRMNKPLPIISRTGAFGQGFNTDFYKLPILLVPASSAKTLNPDLQFNRATAALNTLISTLQYGVNADIQKAISDVMADWDPVAASRWIVPPNQQGPRGEVPIYTQLKQLLQHAQVTDQTLQQIGEAVKTVAKASIGAAPRPGQRALEVVKGGA